tara:strand:+ start:356 stop:544 length:189 start_codon:yes stop_codon:yes gene_type:complete
MSGGVEPTVLTAALRRKAEILKMDIKQSRYSCTVRDDGFYIQRCEEMITIIDSLDAALARAL